MIGDWAIYCWNTRHNLRLNQAEAAEVAGVAARTWRRWENGEGEPDVYRKEQVRDALAVEAAAYLGARIAAAASGRRR
jgi:transcriptional regulator with XRE-family HTH domain